MTNSATLPYPADTAALLFDCDGTLADTMPFHVVAWQESFAEHGIDLPQGFIDERAGKPTETIVREANVLYREHLGGKELDPVAFCEVKEARFLVRMSEVLPIEPVLATARAAHGTMPIAVVSGSNAAVVSKTLKHIGADHLFEVVITADDPIPAKPSPEIFLEAARRLNVPPEKCHVFEDGDPGIVAAKAAGMSWTDVRLVLSC
ncbi:HAD family hydrolase [Adhaeretor mobilis]|uniref:Fructose-1-phosphate phosphatase YqaB n=1 Tax=Adhaeretor mobilis TaxID=1930276 RepID=A0A517N2E5_9BACT|nr:HAD family phosphatase [Adhaeretor mobilis]QDT01307.1 Fructose-1-phosphate phosphatase YqaB [Adhaeretor mobilis]